MIAFSNTGSNNGIVQQARDLARVDSTQWATQKIVNSCNNWLDRIFTYGKHKDRNFQLDDSNHTALPEGTMQLTINVSDYSFLTDEQGNRITNITGVSLLTNGKYVPLKLVDRNDPNIDPSEFGAVSGVPTMYDKIADNVFRLDKLPIATVSAGLKIFFQRSPSYFTASDTTKEPGVAPDLHRGFVVASAYDCALTLGLPTLQGLSVEMQKEEQKIVDYFSSRNTDLKGRLIPNRSDNK